MCMNVNGMMSTPCYPDKSSQIDSTAAILHGMHIHILMLDLI